MSGPYLNSQFVFPRVSSSRYLKTNSVFPREQRLSDWLYIQRKKTNKQTKKKQTNKQTSKQAFTKQYLRHFLLPSVHFRNHFAQNVPFFFHRVEKRIFFYFLLRFIFFFVFDSYRLALLTGAAKTSPHQLH